MKLYDEVDDMINDIKRTAHSIGNTVAIIMMIIGAMCIAYYLFSI